MFKELNKMSMNKKPMVLPKINTLHGGHIEEKSSIHDQMNANYEKYSKTYWEGVKKRNEEKYPSKITVRKNVDSDINDKIRKQPMVLPKINTLHGGHIEEKPSIHDQMNANYEKYSKTYWEGVKKRNEEKYPSKITVWENLDSDIIHKMSKL